jgi:hypothetical protein
MVLGSSGGSVGCPGLVIGLSEASILLQLRSVSQLEGLTLAITWPQGVLGDEDSHAVAAQVHGGVREWQGRQVQEAVTPSQ